MQLHNLIDTNMMTSNSDLNVDEQLLDAGGGSAPPSSALVNSNFEDYE